MTDNFLYIWLGWLVLNLGSFAFLRYSKNARLKRVVYPLLLIGTNAAFLYIGSKLLEGQSDFVIYPLTVVVVVMGILNYQRVAFCDSCGATNNRVSMFTPVTECARCGSKWV